MLKLLHASGAGGGAPVIASARAPTAGVVASTISTTVSICAASAVASNESGEARGAIAASASASSSSANVGRLGGRCCCCGVLSSNIGNSRTGGNIARPLLSCWCRSLASQSTVRSVAATAVIFFYKKFKGRISKMPAVMGKPFNIRNIARGPFQY